LRFDCCAQAAPRRLLQQYRPDSSVPATYRHDRPGVSGHAAGITRVGIVFDGNGAIFAASDDQKDTSKQKQTEAVVYVAACIYAWTSSSERGVTALRRLPQADGPRQCSRPKARRQGAHFDGHPADMRPLIIQRLVADQPLVTTGGGGGGFFP
jgi:hypothetical protein